MVTEIRPALLQPPTRDFVAGSWKPAAGSRRRKLGSPNAQFPLPDFGDRGVVVRRSCTRSVLGLSFIHPIGSLGSTIWLKLSWGSNLVYADLDLRGAITDGP